MAANLKISMAGIGRECTEGDIYTACLPLRGARILELGCGGAEHTRAIAARDAAIEVTAFEVDEVQHEKNLAAPAVPNVVFRTGGAESIPEADASFDIVMMFKSLHHVPGDFLTDAMGEIHRVLKPGGLAYLSEPVFDGEFNDILRMFHDEEQVRRAAFEAICAAVDQGLFELVRQEFFLAPVQFADFADFESKLLNATHTDHRLSAETYATVRKRIEAAAGSDGIRFRAPMRVDLLRKTV